MIRNDIEYTDSLDSLFLKHREGIDPTPYRVGKIGSNIYVLNDNTKVIMDYYFDDVDNEWFDFSSYFSKTESRPNQYFINRSGCVLSKARSSKTKGNILSIKGNDHYPRVGIGINKKIYKLYIHVILAKVFIPNLDITNNTQVDHIDRDVKNFNLNNLRWVTNKENSNNRARKPYKGNNIYIAFSDKKMTDFKFSLKDDQVRGENPEFALRAIYQSIRLKIRYKGFYWLIKSLDILDYLNRLNLTENDIDDSLWVKSYLGDVLVHPLGLLKVKTRRISCGFYSADGKYYRITINNKVYSVHYIVASTFLNGNKPIDKGLEVDHISSFGLDNRVSNLRICTHMENMNNPRTKRKIQLSREQNHK